VIALLARAPTVAAAMQRPYDNFAAIRLGLALAVIVSHAFSVGTGRVEDEPLHHLTGYTLGEHAVNGFFAISGFLVTMSFDRRGWRAYAEARTLRILPGLVAAVLVVGFLIGGALSRLSYGTYLGSPELWRFLGTTLTQLKSNTSLPGTFETNPFRFPMGTVWTLRYEIFCYLGVLVAGLAGVIRRPQIALALVALLAVALALVEVMGPSSKATETSLRLPLIFAAGAALYVWRDRARVSGLIAAALAVLTVIAAATPLYKPLLFLATAYGVLWFALAPRLSSPVLDFKTDLSYGVYLYGWPIQQGLQQLAPGISAAALVAASLVATLVVAALSWFLIEKPALRLKARRLGRATLKTIEPAAP
jgi:peptidoglycan/LPS O-acetylase OafA/YrhL